jgi:DNA-binding response OmpR family regulator
MTDVVNGSSGRVWYIDGDTQRGISGEMPGMAIALDDMAAHVVGKAFAIFVGRKRTAAEMGELWANAQRGRANSLSLLVATTQKQALRLLRTVAPLFVMVETQAKPSSRARFGLILRERLADTPLIAVGPRPLGDDFAFNDYWEPPFTGEGLTRLLDCLHAEIDAHVMQQGPIRLNIVTRTVITPKGRHRMTPKQCALLHFLLDNHDQIVTRRDIMQAIWETSFMEDTRTLDVHIHWLREYIEPEPAEPVYLRTVRGKGYQLCLE